MGRNNLSEEAKRLLLAGEQNGNIEVHTHLGKGGMTIAAGGQDFTDGTPRSIALWKAAVDELMKARFIEGTEAYREITNNGFQMIDELKRQAEQG